MKPRPSKGALVRHVLTPHGDADVKTLADSLETWTVHELEGLHRVLLQDNGIGSECEHFVDLTTVVVKDQLPAIPDLDPTFAESFAATRTAIAAISTSLLDLVNEHPADVRGVAATQVLIAGLRHDLALLVDEVSGVLWTAMGDEREVIVDGVGLLKKDSGKTYRGWDHEAVWSAIRRQAIALQYERGPSYHPTRADVVNKSIDLVREVVTKGSYKTKGLSAYVGLDADEVSVVSWGQRRVVIVGPGK